MSAKVEHAVELLNTLLTLIEAEASSSIFSQYGDIDPLRREAAKILKTIGPNDLSASSISEVVVLRERLSHPSTERRALHYIVVGLLEQLSKHDDAEKNSVTESNFGEKPNGFHPIGIIVGILEEEFDSDSIRSISNNSGLIVDWTLTKKQNYSHKTRLREFIPRIQAAIQGLSPQNQLIIAGNLVDEILDKKNIVEKLSAKLAKIGWTADEQGLHARDVGIKERFFLQSSQHESYVAIRKIIELVNSDLFIIDPWIGRSIFELLTSVAAKDLRIRVLTSNTPADFSHERGKFLNQYKSINFEARIARAFHDRFIIIDNNRFFQIGASIKDAGNKAYMINEMEDAVNKQLLIDQQDQDWKDARPIE